MATRRIVYLDFPNGHIVEADAGDTIDSMNELPVGFVLTKTTHTDPAGDLGYGVWTELGNQVIGATTVYYYERTD